MRYDSSLPKSDIEAQRKRYSNEISLFHATKKRNEAAIPYLIIHDFESFEGKMK